MADCISGYSVSEVASPLVVMTTGVSFKVTSRSKDFCDLYKLATFWSSSVNLTFIFPSFTFDGRFNICPSATNSILQAVSEKFSAIEETEAITTESPGCSSSFILATGVISTIAVIASSWGLDWGSAQSLKSSSQAVKAAEASNRHAIYDNLFMIFSY